tara:strand:- start:1000 stop:1404 length:405 start_codon:yes stop_codon:yes gene_type:complete
MGQFDGFIPWRKINNKELSLNDFEADDDIFDFLESEDVLFEQSSVVRPSMYHVVILGDKTTPSTFLTELIIECFHRNEEQAVAITRDVHQDGKGVCGTYTREVAETKIEEMIEYSRTHNHTLNCMMEKGNKHAI